MIPEGRKNELLAILKQHGYCSVEELAESVYVSLPTMRRHLAEMEKEGLIKRLHGGASYLSQDTRILPFDLRHKSMVKEKMQIGETAAAILQDSDHIFIDSSSSCLCLAKAINPSLQLTVMTNSIVIAQALSEKGHISVELTGGNFDSYSMSIFGSEAVRHISQRHAKICFVSCAGVDAEFAFSNSTEVDISVKRAFAAQAEKVAVLLDSTKINRTRFYKVFDFDEVDYLITDKPLDQNLADILNQHQIEIIIANSNN
ncbi:MAG: DeoR/GlpR transcriptional regulator [Erysipelotrichaceae bacterium]|nr:DeoR/GlpR transcriptional regulator [Erysipelotrichaceae bacterium]